MSIKKSDEFTQELIINGFVYARYEIEGDSRNILYLKVNVNICKDLRESENFFVGLIQLLEDTLFFTVTYYRD